MIKNKKLPIILAAFSIFITSAGLYAHRSFAVTELTSAATMYGIKLNYPEGWEQSAYQFYIKNGVKKPGLLVASHDDKINISIAPKYVGNTATEHPESAELKLKVMLVASTKLKHIPGVSAVQLVTYNYGVAGMAHYVASSTLMHDSQLAGLNLQQGQMVEVANYQAVVKASSTENEATVGFNSQEPLTLHQAIAWLQSPEARSGYAILLSAKLDPIR